MFSLLVTLIAIALVAALALATLYYGGPVFNQGAESAHAARLDAQAQQIMGAMELYNAEMGHYPAVLEDLVSANYLKSIPMAQAAQAVSVAMASTTTWLMAASGNPVIVTQPVPVATCMAYNKLNLGVNAVLATVHSTAMRQCYGTDPANLTVLTAKSGADIVNVAGNPAAVVQIGTPLATPVPPVTDITANGWSLLPNQASVAPPVPAAQVSFTNASGAPVTSLDFGSVAAGDVSAAQTITVTNISGAELMLAPVSATASSPFVVNSNSCDYGDLGVGAYCTLVVSFAPNAAQSYSGAGYTLVVNGTSATVATLPLTGTGTAAVPPAAPFVQDSFTGSNGTLIASHMPDTGSTWTRAYDVAYNYQYSDVNYALLNGTLAYADYSSGLLDRIVVNQATPTSADYDVEADLTIGTSLSNGGYVELDLLSRAVLQASGGVSPGIADAVAGYLYVDGNGGSYAQVGMLSGASVSAALPGGTLTGTHHVRLHVRGTTASMYFDNALVVVGTLDTSYSAYYGDTTPGAAGKAGFALHHTFDASSITLDNFVAH